MVKRIGPYKESDTRDKADKNYDRLKERSILVLFKNIILCNTSTNVDAAVAIARSISHEGLNSNNYVLFLVLLETNNSYVIDSLIGKRDAFLLFSSIKPNWYMLKEAFRILARFKRGELYERCLFALLGIIQVAYKTSKFGYYLYPLSISDAYSIGKYLDKRSDQDNRINRLILDILFDIYKLGIESEGKEAKKVAIVANSIRMSYFDHKKELSDIIPDVLLLSTERRPRQIKPRSILPLKDEE